MNFKSLNIVRNDYGFVFEGTPPGGVGGKITFEGEGGSVTVRLTEAHVAQLLAVVADAMVSTTKELANNLTRETIEHAGLALAAPVTEATEA